MTAATVTLTRSSGSSSSGGWRRSGWGRCLTATRMGGRRWEHDGRQPPWMYYLRYAWQVLFALEVRCGLKDASTDVPVRGFYLGVGPTGNSWPCRVGQRSRRDSRVPVVDVDSVSRTAVLGRRRVPFAPAEPPGGLSLLPCAQRAV